MRFPVPPAFLLALAVACVDDDQAEPKPPTESSPALPQAYGGPSRDAGGASARAERAAASAGPDALPPVPDAGEALPDAEALPAGKGSVLGFRYRMADLDNGLRVVAVPTDNPGVASLQIVVRTGSRDEVEPGKSGFAHFFEHMMFRGTERFPPDAYQAVMKKAGADQNAYTSDDLTNYHVTCAAEDLPRILEVEADRFMNLKYSESMFRTEALAVKGEYLKNFSNPLRRLLERARGLSFTTHPYRHTTMGFFEDIEKMPEQFEHGKAFFSRFYRPDNVVVVLAGDIEPDAAIDAVREHFGPWRGRVDRPEIPVEPPPTGPHHAHITWDGPTAPWIMWAFRGPGFDASGPDSAALDLIETLAFSEASPLYRKIVIEEQWADDLLAWFPHRRDPGLLYVGARLVDAKHASAVQAEVYRALAELKTAPLPAERITRSQRRLKYMLARGLDDAGALAGLLARMVVFDRDPETLDRLVERYGTLTPRDVQAAAVRYFTDRGRTLVTLSSTTTLAPDFDPSVSLDAAEPADRFGGPTAEAEAGPAEREVPDPEIDPTAPATRFVTLPSEAAPLVSLAFVFRAGAANDPAGKRGLAALTAAMVADGGSRYRSISAINDALYPMAASFDAQVDKEMIRLYGTVHVDNLEPYTELVLEQLLEPGFRQEDLSRLKKKLIAAIEDDLVANNDEELGKEVLYAEVYGPSHPYGSLNLGDTDDIAELTLDDVRGFYRDHFRASALIAGVAGAYPEGYPARLEQAAHRLPPGPHAQVSLPEPSLEGRDAVIVQKATPAVAVSFGAPIEVTRSHPDWVALWLARSWLGEHRSSNSHLYQEIREKRGMNYGDYAYIEYFPRGMFQFHPDPNLARRQQLFQVWLRPLRSPNDAHFATRLAVDELERLVEAGLTEGELDATRSYLGKFASLLVQTQARRLGYAIDSLAYGTKPFLERVRRGLAELTVDQVNQVIRAHLTPEHLRFVFVAQDAEGLAERLREDTPSPIEYNTPKPELAARDDAVANKTLGISEVRVVEATDLFRARAR